MKGLLLKDWYMMKKYCRSYFLIAAVFIAVSLFGNDNLFFIFYPCLLCGMIPVNLLGYDERSRWMQYSGTMPYTKAQIVSAKYLIGLLAQVTMLIVTGIAQGIKMTVAGNFVFGEFVVLMLLMLIVSNHYIFHIPSVHFQTGCRNRRYSMDIQLKRGLLDVCVLAAIKNEDSYGYKIIKDMKPYIELS